jgi:gp32 DNA binding protein like
MVDFSSLKKRSGSNLEKLTKAVEAMSSTNNNDDSNEYWKCELDKSGNGYALIRFLPVSPQDSSNEEAIPWVKYYDHGFQGPNGWYIEKSLTSIGKTDAISKLNSELWQSGIEANKEQARKQKRRLHYVSNIYVIKDSKNPENEGKTFKFTYGKKIFEKITQAMNPQFEDDKAIDPFDFWEGANFKLKIRKVDGYQNYDLSEFDSPSPLFEDDSKIEKVWKSQYSLLELLDPKNFKDEATLEARLKRVLGIDQPKPKFSSAEDYTKKSLEEIEDDMFLKQTVAESKPSTSKFVAVQEEEDEDLSYFQNLIDD